eukprot:776360-Rhodomonas_salina.1
MQQCWQRLATNIIPAGTAAFCLAVVREEHPRLEFALPLTLCSTAGWENHVQHHPPGTRPPP